MASWRPLGLITSAVTVFLGLTYLLLTSRGLGIATYPRSSQTAYSDQHEFRAPVQNVWAELSDSEAKQVYAFLRDNSPPSSVGLTSEDSSAIYFIEVLRPNKSDVVGYLDNDGQLPERWARAVFLEGNDDDAFVVEYMVGPLSSNSTMQILPLSYPYNSGRNYLQSPVSDIFGFLEWALVIGENASDITQELLGAVTNRDDPSDPDALGIGARGALNDGGRMVLWLEFFGAGLQSGEMTLLPQGLYVKLDIPYPNPASWTTREWFYNGILYENDTMLRKAMASPGFQRLTINTDGDWTVTEYLGKSIPERNIPPPLSIQPYGARYHLDRSQSYISWMGFSFFISTNQATALSLFDIRYNNTRIIYSLGLQEALAHYAGSEPLQSALEFLDTFFGMGSMMFSLVPGVDCPGYADFLDMNYYKGGQKYTNKNAICIFEFTSDAPLQRHTTATGVTVSRNTYLVVRSVSTVGNYDYTIDYIFYLDGSIEIKLRASGYIFAAFAAEPRNASTPLNDGEFGYRIHPGVHTSLHDHVISFRADIDILGTSNTLVRTSIEPLTKTDPWDKPEIPGTRNTMHMVHTPVTHETGLDWPKNSAGSYIITNPAERNQWGEVRGYRIMPGTGVGTPSHLTILNSTSLGRSAAWSASDLFVLKHHDVEPAGAHHLNYLDPFDPLVDFERMVDGEAIEAEDLVLYFNLGNHHVPSSQDVPNTLMHTSATSVMLMPVNYFDDDVSKYVRQGVKVDRAAEANGVRKSKEDIRVKARGQHEGKSSDSDDDGVVYFGGRYQGKVTVNEEMLTPDLSGYMRGEDGEVVRNKVGGGLIGLFAGKDRSPEGEKEGRDRWDW